MSRWRGRSREIREYGDVKNNNPGLGWRWSASGQKRPGRLPGRFIAWPSTSTVWHALAAPPTDRFFSCKDQKDKTQNCLYDRRHASFQRELYLNHFQRRQTSSCKSIQLKGHPIAAWKHGTLTIVKVRTLIWVHIPARAFEQSLGTLTFRCVQLTRKTEY